MDTITVNPEELAEKLIMFDGSNDVDAWYALEALDKEAFLKASDTILATAKEAFEIDKLRDSQPINGVHQYNMTKVDKVLGRLITMHKEPSAEFENLVMFVAENSFPTDALIQALATVKNLHPMIPEALAGMAGSVLSNSYLTKGFISSTEEAECYIEEALVQIDFDISESDSLALPEYDKALAAMLKLSHLFSEESLSAFSSRCVILSVMNQAKETD